MVPSMKAGRLDLASEALSRLVWAAFFALSTSGWSKGLRPRIRHAVAVATSHSSSWAPRDPLTQISERAGSLAVLSARSSPATRRATVKSPRGELTSKSWLSSKSGLPSTTTGSTPVPFLPVLSAISCSAQSASPMIPEPSSIRTSLSRRGSVPAMAAPSRRAGFASSSSASRSATDSASSSSCSMSTPARPLGTRPNAVSAE